MKQTRQHSIFRTHTLLLCAVWLLACLMRFATYPAASQVLLSQEQLALHTSQNSVPSCPKADNKTDTDATQEHPTKVQATVEAVPASGSLQVSQAYYTILPQVFPMLYNTPAWVSYPARYCAAKFWAVIFHCIRPINAP
ncbi:hypothetical protein [Eisenibacter elegans]|uniref:hypothetical protein n=1 Tax=Eisenibacter elegans TaxID=997 RepID=UPI00047A4251|nr:hypothetical protein [Eisenibacter elegans]